MLILKKIFEYIKNLLSSPSYHDSLEAYIVAHNPQTVNDIDRLEREFYGRNRSTILEKYY